LPFSICEIDDGASPPSQRKKAAGLDLPARLLYISATVLEPGRFALEIIL